MSHVYRQSTNSARDNTRAMLRAIGATLAYSDSATDWFTIGTEPVEHKFYDMRHAIPFWNLFCHMGKGGLVVYYDKPKTPNEMESPAEYWRVRPRKLVTTTSNPNSR